MIMTTPLPMYVFTSQIPTLEIGQVGTDPVAVCLMDGQRTLLQTTLYPQAGRISLYDVGRLYEEHLRNRDGDNGCPYAFLELEVGNNMWEDNMIIYCPYHSNIPAEEFITAHFLTTLSAKRIPLDATGDDETLHLLMTEEEAGTERNIEVSAAFLAPDGNIVGGCCRYTDSSQGLFHALTCCPQDIVADFDHYCLEPCDYDRRELVPLSYTIRVGQRSFTYYVDQDFRPSVRFRFLNAFNVPETIYLEAVTVTKTDTERSMATSHGKAMFYDQVDSQEYEVTTAPLSSEEANWATQLLLSHKVQRVEEDGALTEVLITDMTAEVTDSDEEYRRLKFTYRLATQGASLMVRKETFGNRRFTNQFTLQFD